ncbi:hypothetical protein VII00023_20542 [Vibrio ichthyoenteri ATCC 700023]|uniref:Uncharacterized protein n=1 Tax=Vibrio ichthyoenteri ATCC 700023 TaxID=870968 RepID=F9S7S1_9VIBR|nr:hypothetical protein [Vibrio ichthyoenteri]EGU30971.1 hypothetical protein VII00023_20542 [Vibrio ichthyoenteri ATCC 700023]
MTSHLQGLNQLKEALLAYSEIHSRKSKSKKIQLLYETIETVIDDGLSIDHVVSFLNQNDIPVTKNTLKVNLYRIRKEQGGKPTNKLEIETKPISSSVISTDNNPSSKEVQPETLHGEEELQKMLDEYYAASGLENRYAVLGGNVKDLEGKSTSDKRQLVTNLKLRITQRIRG